MPELPEVETIRRFLSRRLLGHSVTKVDVWRAEVVGYPFDMNDFVSRLGGLRVEAVKRRCKYLILAMASAMDLIFHLRLTGRIELVSWNDSVRFGRLRLEFSDGTCLILVDPRVLARVFLVGRHCYPEVLHGFCELGPELLSARFDASWLKHQLCGRKAPVKSLLLDQRVCCGLGNIYSDEALFRAGIRPTRPAGTIRSVEIERLVSSIKELLKEAIRLGGTTLRDGRYLKPDGSQGEFGKRLVVHGRVRTDCPICGSSILKIKIGGRGSYYCSNCQI